ncbi:VOC family protein [Fictibacillus aquaticus]|uniref:Glyoxalase n=1 Tax=Fictibacillus aquaticus TaxID=2021314 RepID=A0A235F5N7_9BACL|nr:VOC family protein [Fictibacillus aquaticus]OYD56559.1 glyoxalase [Fictibacillus aquaticus]
MSFHKKPATYVSHVHLLVQDLIKSLSFYQDILGFKTLERSENQVLLTLDGKNPLLTIEQPEGVLPRQQRTTGLYHFALLVPNRKELAKVLQHFIDIRYPLQGASDHKVSEALYLADPDGNGIEIYRDRKDTEWQWNSDQIVMATEAIDVPDLLSEAVGEEFTGLHSETIMGHIHLHVADISRSQEFYGALGFEAVSRYGSQALFVSTARYHHHIGLNTWNGAGAPAPKPNSVGMKYYTIVFADAKARSEALNRVEEMGFKSEGYNVTDPSGNVIKLEVRQNG